MSYLNLTTKNVRFGFPLREWQKLCAKIKVRFLVLVLHRRAGKTELGLKKLLDSAVKTELEMALYFYVAPLLKQAKIIAWSRLKQMVAPLVPFGAVIINESELFVRFPHNGSIIRIYGADNPDGMRGVRLDGCVLDEVAQFKPEVWEDIIQPALSDRLGWAWFIGTPKGINLFSKLYFAARGREDWGRALYTVYQTDALPTTEVARLKDEMSEEAFNREFMCDFAAGGESQLISLTDCHTAAERLYAQSEMDYAPVIIGVDPARFGDDRSVIQRRQGLQAYDPVVYTKIDNMSLANKVAETIRQHKPDGVFIDSGAGAGVIDKLRQMGFDVIEVHFGGKADSNEYFNKRTEMWYKMKQWIESGGAIPNDDDLKTELATPTYSYDAQDKKRLESKDDIKKRMPGGESTDKGDALALTFAYPIDKKVGDMDQQSLDDYDPYD